MRVIGDPLFALKRIVRRQITAAGLKIHPASGGILRRTPRRLPDIVLLLVAIALQHVLLFQAPTLSSAFLGQAVFGRSCFDG